MMEQDEHCDSEKTRTQSLDCGHVDRINMIYERNYDGYANIGIIGVGSGIHSLFGNLNNKVTKHVEYIDINTYDEKLGQVDNTILWGDYKKDPLEFKKLLKKFDAVFFVTDLRCEDGIDILCEAANLIEDSRFMKIGVVIIPKNCDESSYIFSERIRRLQENTNMLLTLPDNDNVISNCMGALISIFRGESEGGKALLNDDLWDMIPLIREAGRTYTGFGEYSGENAIGQAYANAVSNLPSKNCITDAKGFIVAAFAAENLSVLEAYGYAESTLEYCPNSKFIFNAFSQSGIQDKAYVAVFTTGIDSIKEEHEGGKLILKTVRSELSHCDYDIEVPDFLKTSIKKQNS